MNHVLGPRALFCLIAAFIVLPTTAQPAFSTTAPQSVDLGYSVAAKSTPGPLPYAVAPTSPTGKKVFAHYFPPYPISLDNKDPKVDYYTKNYNNPNGEKGKWKAVGGLLRDQPIGRAPIPGDFRLADALTEVGQAQGAGIDGFMIDILDWSGPNWDRTMVVNKAAARSGKGFVAVPNIDMTARAASASVKVMAAKLNEFYSTPGAYRLADGRYVLSSFKAEAKSPQWWHALAGELERSYGKRTAFIGVFLSLTNARIHAYAPIAYALSIWGLRSPAAVQSFPDMASKVRKAGSKWMAPIAVQDVRHRSMCYTESENTKTLRALWKRAITDNADMVQMITWNDYSESTQFAPSRAHGSALLDISGYYAAQYKKGKPATITGDELIVSHRIQRYGTKPSAQKGTMNWKMNGTRTPPRDEVEVVTILKSSGTIRLIVGSKTHTYTAPAGLSTKVVPLTVGAISVRLTRGTATVQSITSPYLVKSKVDRWDLQYYAASSRKP